MRLAWRRWLELLSSMRLAISLLILIALASIIGTLIPQGESYSNYQFQFGVFWFKQFVMWGVFDIYHTLWFITLLGLLFTSTSLCVYRYTPSMLKAIRHWRPVTATRRLLQMPYTASWEANESAVPSFMAMFEREWGRFVQLKRFSVPASLDGVVLRSGSGYRWGYICTHIGIIGICLGGLLDSNLLFKWQEWTGRIVPETRDLNTDQIPARSRLSIDNPSFRVQTNIPEGGTSAYGFQNIEDGYLLQPLTFKLKLDRFHVEYHTTGQPKAFVSDITVTTQKGEVFHQSVEVNKPFLLGSVAIYQSTFGDGGTGLTVQPISLFDTSFSGLPSIIHVFEKYKLLNGHTIEVAEFKPINVDMNPNAALEKDIPIWKRFLTSVPKDKTIRTMNLGSAWVYRDRDAQGQAKEFHNYIEPIQIEGHWYFVTGVRDASDQPFRYLHLPLTPQGYIEPYFLWRQYFLDKKYWNNWAEVFAKEQTPSVSNGRSTFSPQMIQQMALNVLSIFVRGGYESVSASIQKQVPKKEQAHIAGLYVRIMDSLAAESYKTFYQQHLSEQHKMPVPGTVEAAEFIRQSILSLSDSFLYGSPVYLQVKRLSPLQSSGFQITRSPGKPVVYFSCVVLVLGVFLLFYWREVRLWCWYKEGRLHLAMTSNRLDSITQQRFDRYVEWVNQHTHLLKREG
jgi:cytochrome c biogenesis protein